MGFKTVIDLDCENATALGGTDKKSGKKNPTTITGYYLGTRQIDSPKSKTGKSALHVFQTEKGNQGVWGKTDLDKKMQTVTPGALVRVTFTGMQETKNNPMYKFRVEVDADEALDVGALAKASLEASEEGTESDDSGEGYEESEADAEEEEYVEEAPPARAAAPRRAAPTPDAARAAKVQALLSKRTTKSA